MEGSGLEQFHYALVFGMISVFFILLVMFLAPLSAMITGPTQAVQGDTVELACHLDGATSAASISWQAEVDGSEAIEADIVTEGGEEEYDAATIKIFIHSDTGIEKIRVECIADVKSVGKVKSEIHEVKVVPQPSPPKLIGIQEGSDIHEGEPVLLTCEDSGGSLVWLVDSEVAWEESKDIIHATKSVSNWWFVPHIGESIVECRNSEQRVAFITFNVIQKDTRVSLETEDLGHTTGNYETVDDADEHISPADVSLKETKQRDAGEVAECSPSEVNTVYSVSLRTMDEVVDIYSADVALEPTRNAVDHVAKNVPDEPSRPKSKPEALIAKTKDSLLSNSAKTSFVSIESSSSPTVSIQHLIFIMISLYYLY